MTECGGWAVPMQFAAGSREEHLYTRAHCGVFDLTHMGRFVVTGTQRVAYLQHVLSGNVRALDVRQAMYTLIPDAQGGAMDDAYLYRFEEDRFLLVVNAVNMEKDRAYLTAELAGFDAQLKDVTDTLAQMAVQGPQAKEILCAMSGTTQVTEPMKNALNVLRLDGRTAYISKTGYTGEPIGYEVFTAAEDAEMVWNRLIELGARPVGMAARDSLRLEAGMPAYGHELGTDQNGAVIPAFAMPMAKFAVSFAQDKGEYVGRGLLQQQFDAYSRIINRDFSDNAALEKRIRPITVLGEGAVQEGDRLYRDGREVGYVTSIAAAPYYKHALTGLTGQIEQASADRSIGFAYVDSKLLTHDHLEVQRDGKRIDVVIPAYHMRADAPPYARPIIYGQEAAVKKPAAQTEQSLNADPETCALELIQKSLENHLWRQTRCINLIPSEMSQSRAVRMLSASDPSFRYAEHKKIKSFYDHEVFYYQGTGFIDQVERMAVEQMRRYLRCPQVETRVTSGQMANTAVYSALMDFKNRVDRKHDPRRLGYVLNNHIIKGGHLSAQPMGALHDYIAIDPATERHAVVNFPVLPDNGFKIDVEETKKIIDQYKPELIIFGKSMVLHREPVAQIRQFLKEQGLHATIMYDMAHVLGLVGDHFQWPFADGADIVTGSTHKSFFGPQRGIIGVNANEGDLNYDLWETVQTRVFPGSVSNHHLGTMLGLLMATCEMNAFRDAYQSAVVHNAKHFAKALHDAGLNVCGDPSISYTETHQVIVKVGSGLGPEVADRLEKNNIIVNYQATPDEEGFTASSALRMGVSEMTRFGFDDAAFDRLAELMADLILRGKEIGEEVAKLRGGYMTMQYCFDDAQTRDALDAFGEQTGL